MLSIGKGGERQGDIITTLEKKDLKIQTMLLNLMPSNSSQSGSNPSVKERKTRKNASDWVNDRKFTVWLALAGF